MSSASSAQRRQTGRTRSAARIAERSVPPERKRAVRDPSARIPARRLNRRLLLSIGVAIVPFAAVVGWAVTRGVPWAPWQPPTVVANRVVATVHNEPILWAEVDRRMHAAVVMTGRSPEDATAWATAVAATLESIVRDVLVRQDMVTRGLVVSEPMVTAEVEALAARLGGQAALVDQMRAMEVTMPELRETQRRGLYLEALMEAIVPVSPADIEAYLAQPGARGMSSEEAAERIRAGRAPAAVESHVSRLRAEPGIWVIDPAELL